MPPAMAVGTPETRKQRMLADATQRLLRRGAKANIQKILVKTHPADLAAVFPHLVKTDQKHLFDMLESDERRGEVLIELKPDVYVPLLQCYEAAQVVPVLSAMASDDVADVMANLPEELADAVLRRMEKKESEELVDLMRYGDDTAGGIMSPDFFALDRETTCEAAIQALRAAQDDVEMAFYVYVVDENQHLVGVVSLRQLVVSKPERRLHEIMEDEVISVRVDMDQEEVARLVARYNFLAVPVVDPAGKILGIVTVDDVIDVFREEATEDILKMAGAGEEMVETASFWRNVRARFPWLVASCIGGIFAALAMGPFLDRLSGFGTLAMFIPVVLGMGGNVGTQSSTIIVRGLATGHVQLGRGLAVVGRELAAGAILGILYGVAVGVAAALIGSAAFYGVVVGLALLASMGMAAFVGSSVPLLFARLHIDPAIATGPFVTTSVDVLGTLTYFSLALFLADRMM